VSLVTKENLMRTHASIAISITALLVAVFGSTPIGEAARNLVVPRNSVGTPQLKRGAVGTLQLKRNAVKARQLAPNAVRTAQVVNGSLLTADFKPGQIPQGPKGDKGDKGDTGSQGPAGLSGYQRVIGSAVSVGPSGGQIATASCPAGKQPVGGGASSNTTGMYMYASIPTTTGWQVAARNTTGTAALLTAFAVCASVAP
jgi:hypothetical protein